MQMCKFLKEDFKLQMNLNFQKMFKCIFLISIGWTLKTKIFIVLKFYYT